jgi:hypothetical protein
VTYYQLRCETCKETHTPLLATQPGELLYPDYYRTCDHCGETTRYDGAHTGLTMLLEGLESFHRKHTGHVLVEITHSVC